MLELNWDKMHPQSKMGVCWWAGFSKVVSKSRWSDLLEWERLMLNKMMMEHSGGKVGFELLETDDISKTPYKKK